MIHPMSSMTDERGNRYITFKLTRSDEPEQITARLQKLEVPLKTYRVMGYHVDDNLNITPVERDRFQGGPEYWEVAYNSDKTRILRVRRLFAGSAPDGPAVTYDDVSKEVLP